MSIGPLDCGIESLDPVRWILAVFISKVVLTVTLLISADRKFLMEKAFLRRRAGFNYTNTTTTKEARRLEDTVWVDSKGKP